MLLEISDDLFYFFFIVLSGTIVNNLFIFLCGRKKRITFAQIIQQCAINL